MMIFIAIIVLANFIGLLLAFTYGGTYWLFIPIQIVGITIIRVSIDKYNQWRRERYFRSVVKSGRQSTHGVYFLDIINPIDRTVSHVKIGHGNVEDRLTAHRTVHGSIKVIGIIYTDTKSVAYELEQRIRNELVKAGQVIPYDGVEQRAKEILYPSNETYSIINHALSKLGVEPYEHHRVVS